MEDIGFDLGKNASQIGCNQKWDSRLDKASWMGKMKGNPGPGGPLMKQSLEERLRQHPHLHARISRLLDVVEGAAGDVEKADEAERRVIEELRRLGQEALEGWAEHRQEQVERQAEADPGLQRKEKKVSTGTPASGGSG